MFTVIIQYAKSNKDKFSLAITCKRLATCEFYFEELINILKIIHSKWYDKFTNIYNGYGLLILPKYTKHLTISSDMEKSIRGYIPSSVKYVTFDDKRANPTRGNMTHDLRSNWDIRIGFYHLALTEICSPVFPFENNSLDDYFPSSVTKIFINIGFDCEKHFLDEIEKVLSRQNLEVIFNFYNKIQ